jgi:hypothetical protein
MSRLGPTCISHRTLGSVVAIDPEDPIVARFWLRMPG